MKKIDWNSLGFAYMDTNCHIRYVWKNGQWSAGELVASPQMSIHIAATALHYGQSAFEGLKAFRRKDGKVSLFRPEENAKRLAMTARRTCMAEVPVDMFVDACKRVVRANLDYVPPYGTGGSMYVRPLLFGSGAQIGVAAADEYTFLVLVTPVGPYYKGGLQAVKAIVLDQYDRAAPLGTGHVKVAGNYAVSLYPHLEAKAAGYPVELYLDAKEHKWIEEFATSNFLGITKDGKYVTAKSGSILPSITNLTLQQIARDNGIPVEVRPIAFEEVTEFAEVAACGTAVVVTPVSEIERAGTVYKTGPATGCGPVLEKLYKTVQGIQYGELPDTHGWNVEVE
ncbi:MAG TPA: branched-chain amino acid aminotransferase [Kiritimatiellia bacterium]|jgi:branched-chain amino acid aminotransferase|nr:branched-chain amino acid aminotransferase [Kiritimatiellia bacterium]OQC59544.1 MAG: Branched-chain-amino-acid aminotransferase [Verrucomicrobia bacterium ADurb.Bin018]HOE00385.1 branched-chain amino acid aminotransferase [Kiritimatiellia bacterium]HOE37073.1 branched-chain amino acid aminotransferase [Kiritimatiellia bacterium]HOR74399.1 branched-chain amino acid aminotransferase [Kiritimatiellia bacterium]